MSDVPPVEESSGQQPYYIRSGLTFTVECKVSLTFAVRHPGQMFPTRGIWWPRTVLHQVSLTFTVRYNFTLMCTVRYTQVRFTPLLQASGGQEQYYIRSA